MAKVSIAEAVTLTGVSKSKIHRDKNAGTISATKDSTGKYVIDTTELARVYGDFEYPPQSHNGKGEIPKLDDLGQHGTNGKGENANEVVISVLEEQVEFLKDQLNRAESNLESAAKREIKLLELADRLQKQNELLMLPSPKKKPGIWGYFRFKR